MSTTRDQLRQARRAYQRVRYPGDLAGDVFARLDAGERHAADLRLDDVDTDTLQKIHPSTMRIGSAGARFGASPWQPVLAIAATLAVLASAVAFAVLANRGPTPTIAMTDPATPPVSVEPRATPKPQATTAAEEASAAEFTIVPSYQSFAFSVPTSLTPASVDEYDRQARTTASTSSSTDASGQQSTNDDASTFQ